MPDFSLPGAVRMETLRRGVQQAGCPSCTPYAAECSQPLNSAKNRKRHARCLGEMKSNQAAAAGAGFAGEGVTAAGAEVGLRFCSAAHAAGVKVCISVAGVVGMRRMMSAR